jgi:hypothetical protein
MSSGPDTPLIFASTIGATSCQREANSNSPWRTWRVGVTLTCCTVL